MYLTHAKKALRVLVTGRAVGVYGPVKASELLIEERYLINAKRTDFYDHHNR